METDGGAVEAGEVSITYLSRLEGVDVPGVTSAEKAVDALLAR